jgi:ferric-dicitrate binding protein FerR (iron transport regulator)
MVGGMLEFDKTPLTQVCSELSERYNRPINCDKVQKPILLTGQFSGTDKLKEILNKIALLNNLTITELPDSSYQITEEK